MFPSSLSPARKINTPELKSRAQSSQRLLSQRICGLWPEPSTKIFSALRVTNTSGGSCYFSIDTYGVPKLKLRSRRQQPLNLPHHPIHFFLIRQRNHEKLVALVEANHAIGKQPDAVEEWVTAKDPTYGRAADADRIHDLRKHGSAGGATESPEQGSAHIFRHLPLKLDA